MPEKQLDLSQHHLLNQCAEFINQRAKGIPEIAVPASPGYKPDDVKKVITKLDAGHCFGICVTDGIMSYTGRGELWQQWQHAIAGWNRAPESLRVIVNRSGGHAYSLQQVFNITISLLRSHQDNDLLFPELTQNDVIEGGSNCIALRDPFTEQEVRPRHLFSFSGRMDSKSFFHIVEATLQHSHLMLIGNDVHSCKLSRRESRYIFLDPNSAAGKRATENKAELFSWVTESLRGNLIIQTVLFSNDPVRARALQRYYLIHQERTLARLSNYGEISGILADRALFKRIIDSSNSISQQRIIAGLCDFSASGPYWAELAVEMPRFLSTCLSWVATEDRATVILSLCKGACWHQFARAEQPDVLKTLLDWLHEESISDDIRGSVIDALCETDDENKTGWFVLAMFASHLVTEFLDIADRAEHGNQIIDALNLTEILPPQDTNRPYTGWHALYHFCSYARLQQFINLADTEDERRILQYHAAEDSEEEEEEEEEESVDADENDDNESEDSMSTSDSEPEENEDDDEAYVYKTNSASLFHKSRKRIPGGYSKDNNDTYKRHHEPQTHKR